MKFKLSTLKIGLVVLASLVLFGCASRETFRCGGLPGDPNAGDHTAYYFKTDSAKVAAKDMQRLELTAGYLKTHPGQFVTLMAYTDPTGTADYNKTLAMKRAEAVKDVLVGYGASAENINIEGHGQKGAYNDVNLPKNHAAARRVVIEWCTDHSCDGYQPIPCGDVL